MTTKSNQTLITEISHTIVANGIKFTGEMFLMLAFNSSAELRKICSELNIKTTS